MSVDNPAAADGISNAINGYEKLAARQMTMHTWRVLSWRNDGLTAHKVDVRELECSCPDHRYNESDGSVCDHVAVALYAADQTVDVGEALNWTLQERQQSLKNIAERVEQQATSLEAEVAHTAQASESAEESDSGQSDANETAQQKSDVQRVSDWLESNGVDLDKVRIWKDNGSVQIDTTEKLDDDEFAVLKDTDEIWYDGDENRNYIKPDNLEAVVGA